jgi:hypothetical protein
MGRKEGSGNIQQLLIIHSFLSSLPLVYFVPLCENIANKLGGGKDRKGKLYEFLSIDE